MKVFKIFIYVFVILLSFSSCVIDQRTYYEYSTGLPGYTMPDYDKIDKSLYKDYFLNDFYLTVNITGTYYPNKVERVKEPYYIMFLGVSQNTKYKIMKINDCIISSNIKGKYKLNCLPDEFVFDEGKKYKNDIYYYTPWDNYPIDLDVKANEIIELQFELLLIDDEDKEYKKEMVYIVKPDIKTKYIDTVLSIW